MSEEVKSKTSLRKVNGEWLNVPRDITKSEFKRFEANHYNEQRELSKIERANPKPVDPNAKRKALTLMSIAAGLSANHPQR